MCIKRMIVLLLALVLTSTAFSCAFADDDVIIPKGKPAKAGTTLIKEAASAVPILDIYEITPGTTIKFWIYRNGHAQVSPTFVFGIGNDLPIRYNNSGNMVKNEKYHSVWRKTTQALNGETYIHFAFVP